MSHTGFSATESSPQQMHFSLLFGTFVKNYIDQLF